VGASVQRSAFARADCDPGLHDQLDRIVGTLVKLLGR
jgi:hypothetical protein